MKNLKFILLAIAAVFLVNTNLQAQEKGKDKKETKKVVIIKETIDEDGNVVKEKIIREGDDADNAFMWRQKGKDGKYVVIKEGKDGKKVEVIVNGDKEIIDLQDIENELEKSIRVEVDMEEDKDGKMMIIEIDKDGEKEVIKWHGDGDMSEELKKELKEKGVQIEKLHEHHGFNFEVHENKPFLGVVGVKTVEEVHEDGEKKEVTESTAGAVIGDVVEDSAAEKAGLQKGDVITKINDKDVADFSDLAEILGSYKVDDKVNIAFNRDGKPMTAEAKLKSHPGIFRGEHFEWNDGEDGHIFIKKAGEDGKHIFIEIEENDGVKEKKVIIKEKKKRKSSQER